MYSLQDETDYLNNVFSKNNYNTQKKIGQLLKEDTKVIPLPIAKW